MNNKIVFFGTGPVAAASLDALAKTFRIELVVTKAAPGHYKGPKLVEELARRLNLPLKFANTKSELEELIANARPQSKIGVIVDYGVMVSETTIRSFELGIINSHFSLLPEWRGADPITFAILSGQHKTGVSLMLIEPTLDTGKLIAQQTLIIDSLDTTPTLTSKLIRLSNQMLQKYLPTFIAGKIQPQPQQHPELATYSRKLIKSDGRLDPHHMTAEECERKVRAFIEFPKSKLVINGLDCVITRASVSDVKITTLDQLCSNDKWLVIQRLIPPSSTDMAAQDFINGYLS